MTCVFWSNPLGKNFKMLCQGKPQICHFCFIKGQNCKGTTIKYEHDNLCIVVKKNIAQKCLKHLAKGYYSKSTETITI